MAVQRVFAFAGLFAHASCIQIYLPSEEFDGKSRRDLCDPSQAMTLANRHNGHEGQPLTNNLGNKGPESGEASIRFGHIFPIGEQHVDLVVVTEGAYTPKNSAVNGLANGIYGTINIQSGTQAKLKYKFVDSVTDEPVVTPSFMMTFYDFDAAKLGSCIESVEFFGIGNYSVADKTELSVLDHGDGSLLVTAKEFGDKHDNPISPFALTDLMKRRAISITFPPLSEFAIIFKSTPSSKSKPGGRNLLFGGPSSLECPERPTCDNFECSSGMVQIPYAEFTNGADDMTCCANKATCMEHTCAQGKVLIVKALETYCTGIECARADDEQCCEDQSVLCSRTELTLSNLTVNNLGGLGPDSGTDHTITYGNVFPEADVKVNLVIAVSGSYRPKNSGRNGRKGSFGVLNVRSGYEAGLRFNLVNAITGAPETVPGFFFSIYDLDTGATDGTGVEYVEVSGYRSYKTFETTEVLAEPIDASSGMFYGTTNGYGFDNPKNFVNLTAGQKKRLVSYEFPHTDHFHIKFGATRGKGGRNLYFRGGSAFYCS